MPVLIVARPSCDAHRRCRSSSRCCLGLQARCANPRATFRRGSPAHRFTQAVAVSVLVIDAQRVGPEGRAAGGSRRCCRRAHRSHLGSQSSCPSTPATRLTGVIETVHATERRATVELLVRQGGDARLRGRSAWTSSAGRSGSRPGTLGCRCRSRYQARWTVGVARAAREAAAAVPAAKAVSAFCPRCSRSRSSRHHGTLDCRRMSRARSAGGRAP